MRTLAFAVGLLIFPVLCQAQTTRPATPAADEARLNGAALAKLDRVLPKVKFDKVGLGDVLEFLQDISGVKIDVPWEKLKAAGIDRNKPASLDVENETFGDVLSVLLVQAAGKPGVIGHTVEHGNIVIVVKGAGATTQAK